MKEVVAAGVVMVAGALNKGAVLKPLAEEDPATTLPIPRLAKEVLG